MKGLLLLPLLLGLMVFGLTTRAHADPPEVVEGVFYHMPALEDLRVAGRNLFIDITDESTWVGNFNGTATLEGTVAVYGPELTDPAFLRGLFHFVGEVQGKTGTLDILIRAWWYPETEWTGYWMILGGTGELADLRGHGTTQGADPDFGNIAENSYEGVIHYES